MKLIGASILSLALPLLATALEVDDTTNRKIMANEAFYRADISRDWKLTKDDANAYQTYAHCDADTNGVITYDEFTALAELPYPKWDGEVLRNIVYKRAGGETLLLDIYMPRVKKFERAPVFYFSHGGGWSGGRKEITGAERPLFEALTQQGIACVSVMYRLFKTWKPDDTVVMRDCIVDCRDGLRFLKMHQDELGLDMERVVVFGSSAGGHITQLLTFSPAEAFKGDPALAPLSVTVSGGISWFGPGDFRDTSLFETEGLKDKFTKDHWASRITKQKPLPDYEAADADMRKTIDEVSPVTWLKKDGPPLLHLHGDQDNVISPNHASHLKNSADKVGANVRVQMVEGASHGWWNQGIQPSRKEIEEMTIRFAVEVIGQEE